MKMFSLLQQIIFIIILTLDFESNYVFGEESTDRKPCGYPGVPAHGYVIFTNDNLTDGTIASYSCEHGFELLGPARRVCEIGNWVPDGIPFCVVNVAVGKAPMQISSEGNGIPQRAIDGSSSAFFTPDTCTLTKVETAPWWYVNLLEPYMVQLVRLDFGKTCCENKPATIIVRVGNNRPDLGTNPICNRYTGILEEGQPLFLPCNPPMPGAFVSIHLDVDTPSYLSICEAFVYTDQALPIERCPTFRDQPPGAAASYNGKCYTFYNRLQLNFEDALSFCKQRSGTLINESNPALQGFISWELWRRHRSDASSQYWMGAARTGVDKTWKWIDGNELTVSFWSHQGFKENCARYDGQKGWLWSDTNCNTELNFICQHQPKACGRPEQPPNSTMIAKDGFEVGGTVHYKCDEGHLLVGPSVRKCLKTGFYNEFPPVCKYIECGLPASILHGSYVLVNDSIYLNSKVKYNCQEGYNLIGRSVLTCDIDERWNGPPPRCEIVECDALPQNYYNTIIQAINGTSYGAQAKISCPKGYRPDGPNVITCLNTGKWSNDLPRCVKKKIEIVAATQRTTVSPKPHTRPTYKEVIVNKTYPKIDLFDYKHENTNPIPGTVPEEFPLDRSPVPTFKDYYTTPSTTTTISHKKQQPPTTITKIESGGYGLDVHLQENEISESANIKLSQRPNVNIPLSIDDHKSQSTTTAKLNLGAIVALAAFGGFAFLAAVITSIVIVVRRNRSSHQHFRHRGTPDSNTVASFESSTSGSRNGLNRYYRQAWENLHESASKSSSRNPLRRKETLDRVNVDAIKHNNITRSCENLERYERDYIGETLDLRDGSELVVTDGCMKEKKRHHHHHHKNCNRIDFGHTSAKTNPMREHRHDRDHY